MNTDADLVSKSRMRLARCGTHVLENRQTLLALPLDRRQLVLLCLPHLCKTRHRRTEGD